MPPGRYTPPPPRRCPGRRSRAPWGVRERRRAPCKPGRPTSDRFEEWGGGSDLNLLGIPAAVAGRAQGGVHAPCARAPGRRGSFGGSRERGRAPSADGRRRARSDTASTARRPCPIPTHPRATDLDLPDAPGWPRARPPPELVAQNGGNRERTPRAGERRRGASPRCDAGGRDAGLLEGRSPAHASRPPTRLLPFSPRPTPLLCRLPSPFWPSTPATAPSGGSWRAKERRRATAERRPARARRGRAPRPQRREEA